MTEIKSVDFSVFNSNDLKKYSVLNVVSHDLFEKGVPKAGGLCDLKLGTIDREYKCHTCKQGPLECPGHFGHIELAEPVYNVLYVKYITKILQSVCLKCSELLSDSITNVFSNNKIQFKNSTETCKTKVKCTVCDYLQPKILLDNYVYHIEIDGNKEIFPLSNILSILSKISDENCKKLGFGGATKPKDFIFTCFPVPPPQVRPSIIIDSSIKSQDDLTYKLVEIIKTNNSLLKMQNGDKNEVIYNELVNLLQYHISTFTDNGISGIPQATQRTGRPIKGVCQRLKAKEGRIRGNLMGKRVDFSGRTVITAEPNIDLNELGVPFKITQNLTYPETVTQYNKELLQSYVDNGPNCEFGKIGAKFIFRKDGKQIDLRFIKDTKLEIGDKVERHLRDGDLVVFNRQPSLHKFSMMGHKIRVMPFSTFRMNLSATNPYNADQYS